MRTWFTSDPHFFDNRIIKVCRQQFNSVEEMNQTILHTHNALVKSDDIVYCLGDHGVNTTFDDLRTITNKLNGHKILILGNHDTFKPFEYIEMGFQSVHTSLQLELLGENTTLVHDPVVSCIDRKRLFICGHVHNFFEELKNVINVCVEVRKYAPLPLEKIVEIKSEMQQRGALHCNVKHVG